MPSKKGRSTVICLVRARVINPNLTATRPFSSCDLTASGHIELGRSGHMRPGHRMAYPSSPPRFLVIFCSRFLGCKHTKSKVIYDLGYGR